MSKKKGKKGCKNKIKHKTLDKAKAAAAMFGKRKNIVTFMKAYKCDKCGFFHVGSSKHIDWSKL